MNAATEAALVALLETYCASQGLEVMSADELAATGATPAQYDWLHKFIALWNASERAQ